MNPKAVCLSSNHLQHLQKTQNNKQITHKIKKLHPRFLAGWPGWSLEAFPREKLLHLGLPREELLYLGLHTRRFGLPGPPHKQNCVTRASPRKELFYLGLPTRRIALPGPPHEKNCSTWGSPGTGIWEGVFFV